MDAVTVALSAFATAGGLAAIALLGLVLLRLSGGDAGGFWARLGIVAGIGIVVSLVGLLVIAPGHLATGLVAPAIALGGLFATLACSPLSARPLLGVAVFAAVLTAAVYVPVTVFVLGGTADPGAQLGTLDLGAALPALVASGAAGLAVLVVDRGARATSNAIVSWRAVLWPLGLLWVAWIAWLVGLELAVDTYTPTIVTNALLMPAVALVAGLLVERARHRRNTPAGVVVGVLAGLAAATPAANSLVLPLAILTAFIVGALSALFLRRGGDDGARPVLATLLLSGGASAALLGFLATNIGLVYTGQPELFFGQAFAVVATAVWALVVSGVLWTVIRLLARRKA